MTKEEAKAAMMAGTKVTHDYFGDDEYVYYDESGRLLDENGYDIGPEFWRLREASHFDTGWSVYKCKHEFVSREYASQPYGTCASCGQTIINQ